MTSIILSLGFGAKLSTAYRYVMIIRQAVANQLIY